jgi:2-polyprenyl-3-methyl-5-hydroxy-6-metoxy-1,4-benzoquinol methylase
MFWSQTVTERRAVLRADFDIGRQFEAIEESCIPSYAHSNPFAAWVSWTRLTSAAKMYEKHAPEGDVLDFGSATGELAHLIPQRGQYHFIEENQMLASALKKWKLDARQLDLSDLPKGAYSAVFALDSLEHNTEVATLVNCLEDALSPSGVLILSGPTENYLYRLGRRIAGFNGHYHHQTIMDIEEIFHDKMSLVDRAIVPMGIPLFAISVWRRKSP